MATNIDINVKGLGDLDKATKEIDKGAKSMNSLKSELRELQTQLQNLDAGSDEFIKLSQKAGEVRDKIKDTSESINANAGPAFERLGNNASLLTGKLASLDFGGASESVRALAQSVKGVSFKELGAELGGFTRSLGTLGKALLTNPIFLLATAILAIIMNFETLKNTIPGVNEALTGVSDEMNNSLETAKQLTEESKRQLSILGESENILKLQGKSEREILQLKIKAAEQALIDLRAQMQAQKNISDAQIATAERNKEITSGIIQYLTIPLQLLLGTVDAVGAALGKDFGLRNKLNDMASSFFFDPAEVKKKAAETERELQDQYRALENQQAGFQLSLNALDKQAADEREKNRVETLKRLLDAERGYAMERAKLNAEINEMMRLAEEQRLNSERETEARRLEMLADQKELRMELIANEQEAEIAAVDAKYIALREKAHGNAELLKQLAEANQKEVDEINEKYAQQELARQQQLNASKFQLASDVLNGIQSLNELFAGNNERSAKRAFQINKGIQIAQAIADTYKGANAIFAASAANPSTILFPAQPFIAAGAAVLAGLANVRKIISTKFEGGSPSGGGSPSAPSFGGGGGASAPTFSPLSTSFLQNNQNQTPPIQAYVLAGNVQNELQAKEKIRDQSTL